MFVRFKKKRLNLAPALFCGDRLFCCQRPQHNLGQMSYVQISSIFSFDCGLINRFSLTLLYNFKLCFNFFILLAATPFFQKPKQVVLIDGDNKRKEINVLVKVIVETALKMISAAILGMAVLLWYFIKGLDMQILAVSCAGIVLRILKILPLRCLPSFLRDSLDLGGDLCYCRFPLTRLLLNLLTSRPPNSPEGDNSWRF
jgi:hypothetical protein